MKDYICSQQIVQKEEIIGNINNIDINVIIRRVKANSKEEAIGKFIIGTKKIDAVKKLDAECYLLDELLTL